MEKDLNKIFDGQVKRYTSVIEKHYQSKYKKAKDKEFIKDELKTGTDFILDWEMANPENKKLLDVFSLWYKRGEAISDILIHIKKAFGEIDVDLPFKRIENGKKITLYLNDEDKALKKLALDERKLLKLLIRYTAFKEIQKRLPEMFNESSSKNKASLLNEIKWTGKKDNKNEFVQLVYGLHKAGLINEGKGEITKILETLAEVFKVELGKGWQANHSGSIHRAKNNYHPQIFSKIEEAYKNYFAKQIKEAKKLK